MTKFDQLIKDAEYSGTLSLQSQHSMKWLQQRISTMGVWSLPNFQGLRQTLYPVCGKMYLFRYMPKTKETLPYYDTFPLVIPVKLLKDGMQGLNLHYLPPMLRAKLMTALMDNYMSTQKSRLAINYQILQRSSKLKLFQPCFKRYLGNYMFSQMYSIEPEEWPAVIFLPVQRFQKATAEKVWRDSRRMVGV
jgi:hypothetical protein